MARRETDFGLARTRHHCPDIGNPIGPIVWDGNDLCLCLYFVRDPKLRNKNLYDAESDCWMASQR
jgi:hypothetical protein